MVRILEQRTIDGNTNYVEAVGLSTDSKPTANICTGSVFTEVDTGDVYMFDEEGGMPIFEPEASELSTDAEISATASPISALSYCTS